ncbi:MAG TPA: hypothetical protein VMU20_18990 [Candidatus Dormibacteraeota bacterium]|nr:hypothetical protein [Candidatus Dormibacteraeota bacterium]
MDDDIYLSPERLTAAERKALGHLESEFRRRGIPAEARIVDVEPPHRSEEATTVEVRVAPHADPADPRAPARVVRVIWYEDVPDDRACSALVDELEQEASTQLAER